MPLRVLPRVRFGQGATLRGLGKDGRPLSTLAFRLEFHDSAALSMKRKNPEQKHGHENPLSFHFPSLGAKRKINIAPAIRKVKQPEAPR
ncbi:MAG: hypothetical protein A2V45_15830 [Candidatus Aminicenantes bacterium RBG_19FT_COMBO_58_17]|nr:MAG: hypothetical protein A2V45_15830 [Candidatus Aminicenantes bacterium RBG_19FT_COMBO_58_17]HCS46985.1 hypothetical protein [Candidatus Aminicenantes bacterium]